MKRESDRIAFLRSLDLLRTPVEPLFDDITTLACHLMKTPIAMVTLVDEKMQWFKGQKGIDCVGTPLSISICDVAIRQPDLSLPLVVPDARADPRFSDFSNVQGPPYIRMYAGFPLVLDDGFAIGTLCVIDTEPRTPTPEQIVLLGTLARNVTALIGFRHAAQTVQASEERNRSLFEASIDAVVTFDSKTRITGWNARADLLFDFSGSADRTLTDLIATTAADNVVTEQLDAWLAEQPSNAPKRQFEMPMSDRHGITFMAELSMAPAKIDSSLSFTVFIRDVSQRYQRDHDRQETQTRDIVIYTLARLAESRDSETGGHIERVQHYCQALAEQLQREGTYPDQLDDQFVRMIYSTSPLHDIGKVCIPDHVLLKPGKLTPGEYEIMKTHAAQGAATLDSAINRFPNTHFLQMARDIAATHHERYDGTGYPAGLAGQNIPLCGRIVALADVYDALTSQRVYKPSMTHEAARGLLIKESGRHFDPCVVDAFLAIEDTFVAIRRHYTDLAKNAA